LGPSDYKSFLYVKVSIGDVDKWVATFTPLSVAPDYVEPRQMLPWWVKRGNFSSLEFFQPQALSHRIHDWIGVSRRSGELFLFTYTM